MALGQDPSVPIYTAAVGAGIGPAYSAAATITPASSGTDIATLVGSATKKLRVKRIFISGTQTTGGQVLVHIIKRTTANSGGTSTTPTIVEHDTDGAAPTGVFRAYSANPTLGTGASLRIIRVPMGATTVTTNNTVCFEFGTDPVTLDGVAEALSVNLNGVTVTGGSINVSYEWTEGD